MYLTVCKHSQNVISDTLVFFKMNVCFCLFRRSDKDNLTGWPFENLTFKMVKLKYQGALPQTEEKIMVLDPLRHYVSPDLVGSNISSIVYLTATV